MFLINSSKIARERIGGGGGTVGRVEELLILIALRRTLNYALSLSNSFNFYGGPRILKTQVFPVGQKQ